MTLQKKTAITSVILAIGFTSLISAFFYPFIVNRFQEIENQRTEYNIQRVDAVIKNSLAKIDSSLLAWSIWDDSYNFLEDRNPQYVSANLSQDALIPTNVDEVLFVDKSGVLVTSAMVKGPKSKITNETNFPEDLYKHFATGSALLNINTETKNNQGFIRTEDGLILFVIRDVYLTNGKGTPKGSIVFAKYFDEGVIDSLRELTQFEASTYLWDDPKMTPDYLEAKNAYLKKGNQQFVNALNKDIISGYYIIKDVYGQPQAIVRTDIQRDITIQGHNTTVLLLTIFGVASLLLVALLNFVLGKFIISKVFTLSKEVESIAGSAKSNKRLTSTTGNDEVDNLRNKINEMLDSLQTIQMAVDSSNSHIIITDPDGKILYANHAAEIMTGFSFSEMAGKTPRLWGRQMTPEFYVSLWDTIKTRKQVFKGEVTNKRQSGELYTAMATISPIIDYTGILKGYVAIEDDITEKKKSDLVLNENLEKLEKLNSLMVGRELKMAELKKEIESLKTTSENK